ncbi:uncharacterized protein LOC130896606 [Diorhabda carinulata]|uniref:uncharacterized protein LOC130896606 n=1 Tax=Diorhabda carinulata TaxID=1163345 RepID=UPI0025A10C06|nr:uncharacterized protein LOC130896606 [Diorhabda carinulata]
MVSLKKTNRKLSEDEEVCATSLLDIFPKQRKSRISEGSASNRMDIDFIRMTKKHDRRRDIKLEVEKMRKSLPRYDIMEIRQFRLPFHEALITNLHECGYPDSAALIGALIAYQDELRKESAPGSSVFILPQLKFAKNELETLAKNLQESESLKRKDYLSEECHIILKLGVDFAFGNSDWWWVGEQILLHTIMLSSSYFTKIGSKFEALSRYVYAQYLLDNLKEYDSALKQLKVVHCLARNKMWTCKHYFPQMAGTLYMHTNQAMFECLITEVKRMLEADAGKAIILADQARKRAAEACYRDGEAQALVLKGICEMQGNLPKSAVNSFNRAICIQARFGTIEEVCKIKIHLAKAYLMDGCINASLNVLMELKNDAEENDLPFYLGQAYKNLAEYYLSIGESQKASPLLEKCIDIFKNCETTLPEIKVAENLRAISSGLQLLPKYIDVLKKAGDDDEEGKQRLLALLAWKNERQDFWQEGDLVVDYTPCESIISESYRKVRESRPNVLDAKFHRLSSKSVTRRVNISTEKALVEETGSTGSKCEAKILNEH